MSKTVLISGGARSGKSEFAEKLLEGCRNLYIATSIPFDDEMRRRVALHRERRGDNWSTAERYRDFDSLKEDRAFQECEGILLDCITIMLTNMMMDEVSDFDSVSADEMERAERAAADEIKSLIDLSKKNDKKLVIVTNEIGLGIVPENRLTRLFRDSAGRLNRYIAEIADEVYMVFMGIPNRIK